MIKSILVLGDERLYQKSEEVTKNQLENVIHIANDLKDTFINFKKEYGFGRAIASPQIGQFKRIIYFNTGDLEEVFINPVILFDCFADNELIELWDDCMSFPGLYVKVNRFQKCKVMYKDLNFYDREIVFEGDMAELFQHEYDHLDGILATLRAKDKKSFKMKPKFKAKI